MRFCNKQSISEDLYKELLLVTIVMFSFSSNHALAVGCFCGVTSSSLFSLLDMFILPNHILGRDVHGSCSHPSSSLCLL